jgi:hypothetical protein
MRTACLSLLVIAALARTSAAEINMADTLEWTTADADAVVTGTIVGVDPRTIAGVTWYVATVQIGETIKGAIKGDRLTVAMRADPGATPVAWQQRRAELLLFLVKAARRASHDRCAAACGYDRAPWALRAGSNDDGVYDLGLKSPDMAYTTAFTAIHARADLLAVARAAASSTATRARHIDAPADSDAFHALYGGSAVWLYVPVDAALEQRALAWIASPELALRVQGAETLADFRSAATIRRLVALLADPGTATVSESGQPEVRRYLVRKVAHELLTAWGHRHAAPIIDEPTRSPPGP